MLLFEKNVYFEKGMIYVIIHKDGNRYNPY